MEIRRNVTYSMTFKFKGSVAHHRKVMRLWTGVAKYRFEKPLIHRGRKYRA